MAENDLYTILQLNKTASIEEIKKAYRALALKYHPDKVTGNKDNFIKICSAYEILSNPKSKKEYDDAQKLERDFLFNDVYKFFMDNPKKVMECIDNVLLFFCQDKKYQHYINQHNYKMSFTMLLDNILEKNNSDLSHITQNIECDLFDRYYDKHVKIEIKRQTRTPIELNVPLRNDINIFYDEGEMKDGKKGDIIINTITNNNFNYYTKNGDMYKEIILAKIPDVYKYFHYDGSIHDIKKSDLINEKYFIILNVGLPRGDGSRGDFIGELLEFKNI